MNDAERDGALWIRWAAKHYRSFKTEALSTISLRALSNRLIARDEPIAWNLSYQAIVLKAGLNLGLLKAA